MYSSKLFLKHQKSYKVTLLPLTVLISVRQTRCTFLQKLHQPTLSYTIERLDVKALTIRHLYGRHIICWYKTSCFVLEETISTSRRKHSLLNKTSCFVPEGNISSSQRAHPLPEGLCSRREETSLPTKSNFIFFNTKKMMISEQRIDIFRNFASAKLVNTYLVA